MSSSSSWPGFNPPHQEAPIYCLLRSGEKRNHHICNHTITICTKSKPYVPFSTSSIPLNPCRRLSYFCITLDHTLLLLFPSTHPHVDPPIISFLRPSESNCPLLLWMPPTKSVSSRPSAWVHRALAWHGSATWDRLAGSHPHGPSGDVFSYGVLLFLGPIAKVTNPWDETPLIVAPSH